MIRRLSRLLPVLVFSCCLVLLGGCGGGGGGGGQEPESPGSDTTAPSVTITGPTSASTYDNGSTSTISPSGTASDNAAVSSVTWVNEAGGSGTASCTDCGTPSASWTIAGIALTAGSNAVTVTVHDSSGNTGTDTIDIAYAPEPGSNTAPNTPRVVMVESNDATLTTGGAVIFKDDLVTFNAYGDKTFTNLAIDATTGHGGSATCARFTFAPGEVEPGNFMLFFGRGANGGTIRSTEDFTDIYVRLYSMIDSATQNYIKTSRVSVFADSSWSQAAVAHLWGEQGSTHLEQEPVTSVSGSTVTASGWNDTAHFTWLGPQEGSAAYYSTAYLNRWTCIEFHAKLNTPGNSDGVFETWVDGVLDNRQTGLNFRGSYTAYAWNMVNFEAYLNGGADGTKHRWYDHIVVSTAPIGLARSPVNPVIYKTAFTDPDAGDAQTALNAQVSTTQGTGGLVWDGTSSGTGNTITVNSTSGTFTGARAGFTSLAKNTKYYVRVRQSDGTVYSAWSSWYQLLTVI